MVKAILALALVRCGIILPPRECNAASALQDKVLFADFGDQVFAISSMSKARLVVRERAALAIDERCKVVVVRANLTRMVVAHSELVVARQLLEDFFCTCGFRFRSDRGGIGAVGAIDIIYIDLLHTTDVPCRAGAVAFARALPLAAIGFNVGALTCKAAFPGPRQVRPEDEHIVVIFIVHREIRQNEVAIRVIKSWCACRPTQGSP